MVTNFPLGSLKHLGHITVNTLWSPLRDNILQGILYASLGISRARTYT